MTTKLKLVGFIACAVFVVESPARAATYTYTGNDFTAIQDPTPSAVTYTTSMSITGSFTVAGPLAPNLFQTNITAQVLSFSFSDGVNTLTNNNTDFGTETSIWVGTDSSGNIIRWEVALTGSSRDPYVVTITSVFGVSVNPGTFDSALSEACNPAVAGCTGVIDDFASNHNDPGSWGSTIGGPTTPLPAALPLFATGLAGLGLLGWRRKRKS